MDTQATVELLLTSGLVGTFLPIIIGWINKFISNKYVREVIALVISGVVGFFVARELGQLDPANILLSISTVAGIAQVAYLKWFSVKWEK